MLASPERGAVSLSPAKKWLDVLCIFISETTKTSK